MTETEPLSAALTERILRHLGMGTAPRPDHATLQSLVTAYTRTVPWESASRIVRRAQHDAQADCAVYGADFWQRHFALGSGGTCYESNYAFFGLLLRLGYRGYLTLNNMSSSIACHSAIVVLLDGRRYLVDVGYPVHAVLPLDITRKTELAHPILNYTIEPRGDGRYEIQRQTTRDIHGFMLIDQPVPDADYRAVGIHDYRRDGGQFLNEVVIHKVVDGKLWRFNSDQRPFRLQQFVDGERRDHPLGASPAADVAAKFGLDEGLVAEAMRLVASGVSKQAGDSQSRPYNAFGGRLAIRRW